MSSMRADLSCAAGARRPDTPTDLPRRIHLLGAGGAGVSGVGRILAARGVAISGHDAADSAMLETLRAAGIPVAVGASEARGLPADAELVVRSAAVPVDDPQVAAARARGIPVMKYAEVLARLAPPERTLAVAGTHGKTTATWMLWHVLESLARGREPVAGALVGGICSRLETNALAGGDGGWFCVEACEYDRTFLRLSPHGAIVTNVEGDHLDYYGSLEAIHTAFARFADRVAGDGLIVLGRRVPEEVELGATRATVWRLGRELDVDLLGEDLGHMRFRLRGPGWATRKIALAVPGAFNVENAALALALAIGTAARAAGVEPGALTEAAAEGIERFLGVRRRFERWGSIGGVEVVHDYAHHPTEIAATIEAALRVFPARRLHVLFQPHQHSRTSRFLEEFAESLRAADRVVVADVYGARKHIDGQRHAGAPELVLALARRGVDAVEGGPAGSSMERFVEGMPERAAALVLGAGDIDLIRDDLFRDLALRGALSSRARP